MVLMYMEVNIKGKKDQHQVVSHAGGVLKSEAVEAVLKTMYGRHHEGERRLDGAWRPGLRPRGPPPPRTPAWSQNPWGPGGRFQSGGRGPAGRYPSNPRRTYLQDDAEYQDGEEVKSEQEEHDLVSTTADDDMSAEQVYLEHEAEFDQDDAEGAPWPAVPEDPEEAAEDDVPPVEVQEAFLQGWRARAKAAPKRNRRGFLPPDQRPGAATPGQRDRRSLPDTRNRGTPSQAVSRPPPAGSTTDTNAKKKVSSCRSCGQLGHSAGDARCPHVIEAGWDH